MGKESNEQREETTFHTFYLDADFKDKPDPPDVHNFLFTASEAEAHFDETNFFIKKGKRPGDEIQVAKLPLELQKRWTERQRVEKD